MAEARRRSRTLDALRLGQLAATHLPSPLARGVAEGAAVALSRRPLGRAWDLRRRMLARHIVRVMGDDAPPVGSRRMGRLVDEAIASYARYWAESFRIPGLTAEQLDAGITYDGYERIAAGRAAGRGTILVLPHLGGWEWAGTQLAAAGHPVSVVVERLEQPDVYEWFVAFRERLGMHVIPVGPSAASRCAAALADNHLLCLLSDRLIAGTGVEVDFFGERTVLPAGPATLALRTGAMLLPAAVYFAPRTDHHLGVVMAPLDTHRQDGLRADVLRITQEIACTFESLIRRAPTQWHLMQPNWPSDRDPGASLARVP
jgi:KDO2-lipid IV(A) lauroyltransferase